MKVFLTGAAGLIGGELAAQLVAAGHGVVGLVRSSPEIRSNDGRLLETAAYSGEPPQDGQILTCKGDVAKPDLGLDGAALRQLQQQVDLVVHCAAITSFDADPGQYRSVNVDGTAHVRNLFPEARFLYVSTAYVCGTQDGRIAEAAPARDAEFANGYEASKALAEKKLVAGGGRHVIARPSIVVGAHDCGTIQSFDTIYAVFRLIAEGQITRIPATANATLGFVPVDHVIGGLMDIIAHWERAEGQVFHLSPDRSTPMEVFVDAIASFAQLDRPEVVLPGEFLLDGLSAFERRLYRRTAAFYESYFQRSPQFANDNLKELSGRECPPVDKQALRRMIQYCVNEGFIRAER